MPKFATKAADNMFCQARYEAAKFNERFLISFHKALRYCLPCFSVLVNQASHLTNIRSHRLIQFV